MDFNALSRLLDALKALLEPLLIGFITWYEAGLTEKSKMILNLSQAVLEASRTKEGLKEQGKEMSSEELAKNTTID